MSVTDKTIQVKCCKTCGVDMVRKPMSHKRWERKKYCSPKCQMIGLGKNPDKPDTERFWSRVLVPEDKSRCWVWFGANSNGYGNFNRMNKQNILAHRFSWELHKGPIPDGLFVMHMCDNPSCVNPNHLKLGTNKENSHDSVAKGRITNRPAVTGENNSKTNLDERHVKLIRLAAMRGIPAKEISDILGLSYEGLRGIIKGRTWKHIL